MRPSPISATVDFDQDGIQHGFLKLPHSHDASAWGSIMIPVTVARNGVGPTALLTGANHGDEYEGPIALFDLARSLEEFEIAGRVIIVPALNFPAFQAATRTSPIDRGNMNRIFPGDPAGTVTEKIADYVQRTLLPMADVVLDFHSGGKTLDFVPLAAAHYLDDPAQQDHCAAAMRAFNAPYSLMMREIDSVGMYDTAAEDQGKVFVTTELGGGGTSTVATVTVAKRGVHNLLKHAGILDGTPEVGPTVDLAMPDDRCFITSESAGLVEPCVELGAAVEAGQLIARVHPADRTGAAPAEYRSRMDGLLIGRHFPGLIAMGDVVGVVAEVS